MAEKDDLEQLGGRAEEFLKRRISRRQAIKVGGLAALGMAFSKPLLQTIRPKPAFANYVPTGACCLIGAPDLCGIRTAAECEAQGGFYLSDGTICDTANQNQCVEILIG